jgi:hypothetical protein
MPAKKSKAESKTKEVKSKKSAAPAAKKSPKTVTKSPAKAKSLPVKVAKPAAPAPVPVITQDQIATRAYYIGERRQTMGWPGDPSTDWIEAEAQLIAEAKRKKI